VNYAYSCRVEPLTMPNKQNHSLKCLNVLCFWGGDWCYRFKQGSWKAMFTPVGEIIHLGEQSSRQKRAEMILQLRGSILLFMKKHKSFLTYTLACLLVALFFFLRVLYWLVMAMLSRNSKSDDILIARTYLAGACKALLGAESLC